MKQTIFEQFLNNPDLTLDQVINLIDNPDMVLNLSRTLDKEGDELTDHENDLGGVTKFGITEDTARSLGYEGKMEDLTMAQAMLMGAYEFWFRPRLDEINHSISKEFAFEMYDASYLCGHSNVIKYIQRFLNLMNRRQVDWPDLEVDGIYGSKTLGALLKAKEKRGVPLLLKNLHGCVYHHFFTITEAREKNEDFFNGWVDKRIG